MMAVVEATADCMMVFSMNAGRRNGNPARFAAQPGFLKRARPGRLSAGNGFGQGFDGAVVLAGFAVGMVKGLTELPFLPFE